MSPARPGRRPAPAAPVQCPRCSRPAPLRSAPPLRVPGAWALSSGNRVAPRGAWAGRWGQSPSRAEWPELRAFRAAGDWAGPEGAGGGAEGRASLSPRPRSGRASHSPAPQLYKGAQLTGKSQSATAHLPIMSFNISRSHQNT